MHDITNLTIMSPLSNLRCFRLETKGLSTCPDITPMHFEIFVAFHLSLELTVELTTISKVVRPYEFTLFTSILV